MPTQITSRQVKEHYDSMIYIVKMLQYWSRDNQELQEFLDYGNTTEAEPPEFVDFKEAIASVYYSGRKLGAAELMNERQLFALARNLCRSEPRQKSYLRTLRAAKSGITNTSAIISFCELEERYQWHLWLKRQEVITGKKPSTKFRAWLQNIGCVTFFDFISPYRELDDAKLVAATD